MIGEALAEINPGHFKKYANKRLDPAARCPDLHASAFEDLQQVNLMAGAGLTKALARASAGIYLSGDIGLHETRRTPSAALELWATDLSSRVVRVSKQASVQRGIAVNHTKGRFEWVPGVSARRRAYFRDAALQSRSLRVDEFALPADGVVDEALLAEYREHSDAARFTKETGSPLLARAMVGEDTFTGQRYPAAHVACSNWLVEQRAYAGMSKSAIAATSQEKREVLLRESRETLVHNGGLQLVEATNCLIRAVQMLRDGKPIYPQDNF